MSDKLHDYIRENRSAFDQLQPPDVWNGVVAGMKHNGLSFKPKNFKTMIKYGFGASAIVVASFVALYNSKPQNTQVSATVSQQKTEKPQRSIFDSTPSVIAPFVASKPSTVTQQTRTPKAEASENSKTETEPPVPPVPPLPDVAPVPPTPPASPAEPVPPLPPPSTPNGQVQKTTSFTNQTDDIPEGPEFTSIDSVFKDIKRVEVNGQVCNVTIISHKSDEVKLKGEIKEGGGDMLVLGNTAYQRREYKIKVQRSNDILKVWIVDHKLQEKVKCSPDGKIESYLNLEIPENTSVKAYNCSGNITVSGPLRTKTELKSSFGNVAVDNISADLKVNSSSGNITASNITGRLESNSSFGNQKFDNITGDITLRSSSGWISVSNLKGNADVSSSFGAQRFTEINGNLKTLSSSGNVTVTNLTGNASVKSSFGAQYYETVEGDIISSASSGDIKVSDHKGQLSLSTSFGNIRGKNITLLSSSDFKATSGNISMNFINKLEDLRFDLVSSSGNLSIEKSDIKKRSEKELRYGNGPILIKGVSSFGNQNYN